MPKVTRSAQPGRLLGRSLLPMGGAPGAGLRGLSTPCSEPARHLLQPFHSVGLGPFRAEGIHL